MTVDLLGYAFNLAGSPVEGATAQVLTKNTTTQIATVDTDSNGKFEFSGIAEGLYDIKVTSGSSVRWRKYDDEIQTAVMEAGSLRLRGTNGSYAHVFQGTPTATRTITFPDASGTVALSGGTGDIAVNDNVDFSLGSTSGGDALLRWSTGDSSNEALVLGLGDTSQQFHITDKAAIATDWARSAGTNPELAIHNNAAPITDYLAIGNHDGTTASIDVVGGTTLSLKIGGTAEATLTASTLDVQNNAVTTTGVVTAGGFTIGSAAIVESELEMIDGITAGTAAASKALVLDANKDVGTIRNLTIDGTFSDGNYTFDTSGNVSGLGTIGSGAITSTGTVQGTVITATTGFAPDASDGAYLGTSSLQFTDLFLADGAVINLGDDQDVTLTHVADTGVLLNSTRQLQFGDSGTYIHQSADGVLDLVSDTEIEINATTIDINGAVDISGNATVGGNLTINGTTTTVDTATLAVEDPLIALATGNSADSIDVGFYAKYVDSGTKYAGLFRDASDSDKWKLFATTGNSHEVPGTTVNTTSGFTLGTLVASAFEGDLTGDVTGDVTGNASGTAATVTGGTQASITTVANVTEVGALDAGSITSNFGNINIGASTFDTTGAVSTGNLSPAGDISTADAKYIKLGGSRMATAEPASNTTGYGVVIGFDSAGSVSAGDAVYINSSGKVAQANAQVSSVTDPCIGIATNAGGSDGDDVYVLTHGIWRMDAEAFTAGDPVYVGESAGALTPTAPSTDGDYVQRIGIAVSDDCVLVMPSIDVIEHA